jgi:hypothetical protein
LLRTVNRRLVTRRFGLDRGCGDGTRETGDSVRRTVSRCSLRANHEWKLRTAERGTGLRMSLCVCVCVRTSSSSPVGSKQVKTRGLFRRFLCIGVSGRLFFSVFLSVFLARSLFPFGLSCSYSRCLDLGLGSGRKGWRGSWEGEDWGGRNAGALCDPLPPPSSCVQQYPSICLRFHKGVFSVTLC